MKREEVAEELNDEGKGAEAYMKVGRLPKDYTKVGEVAEGLYEGGSGCQRVIRRGEKLVKSYTNVGEVADGLYEDGRGC
jgi:hypothetical protein